MEQRNEPSTDIEITLKKPKNDELLVKGGGSGREPINTECAVRALNTIAEVSPQWSGAIRFAADRLEQLERDNAALKSREEKAEADRDAAIDVLERFVKMPDDGRSTAMAIEHARQNVLSSLRRWHKAKENSTTYEVMEETK